MLSIIVANYNNGKYVRKCLDSVLDQTFKDLEIVVYDDGSSDGSLAIIGDFAQRHPGMIQVMHDPVNRGVAFARHQAILAARGEYITTLDSDDFYFSREKLAAELDLASTHRRNTGKDIIAFSNTVMVSARGQFLRRMGNPENIRQGNILEDLLTRACLIPRDFIMSKEAYFLVGGYNASLWIREDWDLKIRLAKRFEFRYSGGDGTAYRRHAGGLSASSAASIGEWEKWLRIVFERNLSLVDPQRQAEVVGRFETFLAARSKDFATGSIR